MGAHIELERAGNLSRSSIVELTARQPGRGAEAGLWTRESKGRHGKVVSACESVCSSGRKEGGEELR